MQDNIVDIRPGSYVSTNLVEPRYEEAMTFLVDFDNFTSPVPMSLASYYVADFYTLHVVYSITFCLFGMFLQVFQGRNTFFRRKVFLQPLEACRNGQASQFSPGRNHILET
jgi:hypothetical protein